MGKETENPVQAGAEAAGTEGNSGAANVSLDGLTSLLAKRRGARRGAAKAAAGSGGTGAAAAAGAAGAGAEAAASAGNVVAGAESATDATSATKAGTEAEPARESSGQALDGAEGNEAEGAETSGEPGETGEPGELGETGEPGEDGDSKVDRAIRKMERRIDKLTRRLKEREATIEELRTGLEKPGAAPKAKAGNAPSAGATAGEFSEVPEVREFNGRIGELDAILRWAEENAEGGTVRDGEQNREFDAREVRSIRRKAEAARGELVAERAAMVGQLRGQRNAVMARNDAEAVKAYPFLNDEEAPEYAEGMALLRSFPGLNAHPERGFIVGDYLRGRAARMSAKEAGAKPEVRGQNRPAPKAAAVVVRTAAVAPRGDGKAQILRVAEEEFKKTGSADAFQKLLAARRSAARAA